MLSSTAFVMFAAKVRLGREVKVEEF